MVDEELLERPPSEQQLPKVTAHSTAEVRSHLRSAKTLWCPGCTNGIVTRALIDALLSVELDADKVAVVAGIGCAGRITAYRETEDGRYLITLTGICRFRVAEELDTSASFRAVKPDFAPFAGDLAERDDEDFPRERLLEALNEYLSRRELKADWKSVMNAPAETLVNALAMLCPFEPNEKQALLEMAGTTTGSNTVN